MKTPLLYLLLAGINDIARNNIEKKRLNEVSRNLVK